MLGLLGLFEVFLFLWPCEVGFLTIKTTSSHATLTELHIRVLYTVMSILRIKRAYFMRNFKTNMFRFGTASSIVVRSLATWSAFGCQRKVIAIFLFWGWLIFGLPSFTTIQPLSILQVLQNK